MWGMYFLRKRHLSVLATTKWHALVLHVNGIRICTKKVEPDLIKNIEFYDSAKAKPPAKRCKSKGPVPPATEAQQIQLLEMWLSTGTSAVALITHKAFTRSAQPWFLNLDDISEDERETVNQASSALWHRHRVGRVNCTQSSPHLSHHSCSITH